MRLKSCPAPLPSPQEMLRRFARPALALSLLSVAACSHASPDSFSTPASLPTQLKDRAVAVKDNTASAAANTMDVLGCVWTVPKSALSATGNIAKAGGGILGTGTALASKAAPTIRKADTQKDKQQRQQEAAAEEDSIRESLLNVWNGIINGTADVVEGVTCVVFKAPSRALGAVGDLAHVGSEALGMGEDVSLKTAKTMRGLTTNQKKK